MLVNIIIGCVVFSSVREHLLTSLLRLEFLVLSIFFLFILFLGGAGYYYSLIYLVVTVCEGALGLSVLVSIGRSHGGDYLKRFSFFIF